VASRRAGQPLFQDEAHNKGGTLPGGSASTSAVKRGRAEMLEEAAERRNTPR
jgi:hypothetical protein